MIVALAAAPLAAQPGRVTPIGALDPVSGFLFRGTAPVLFSPDGRFVFFVSGGQGGVDNEVISARVVPGGVEIVSRILTSPTILNQIALSPDGRRLAAVGVSGIAIFYDVHPSTGSLAELGRIFVSGLLRDDTRPVFNADGRVLYWGNTNFPGQLRVLDADPAGGIDSVPLQEVVPLGSSLELHRLDVSADGSTLVVAGVNTTLNGEDKLVVYDIDANGFLTERVRFEPGVDLLWVPESNPEVTADGMTAYVVDASVTDPRVLEIFIGNAGPPITTPTATQPTETSPFTLTLSEEENTLVCVGSTGVTVFTAQANLTPAISRVGAFLPGADLLEEANNAVLNPTGSLCAVAGRQANAIAVFNTGDVLDGDLTQPLVTVPTGEAPTALGTGFDFRRLAVVNDVNPVVRLFEVETLAPTIVDLTELADPSIQFDSANTVAVDPQARYSHATSSTVDMVNGSFVSIDNLNVTGVQASPVVRRQPYQGLDVVTSADGSVIAAVRDGATRDAVHIYRSPLMPLPSGTVEILNSNYSLGQLALSADGDHLYLPDQGNDQVHVVQTADGGTITPAQSVSLVTGDLPTNATLSPDQALLAVTLPGSDQVAIYDRNPGTGLLTLLPRRYFLEFDLTAENNVVFLPDSSRALVGVEQNVFTLDPQIDNGVVFSRQIGFSATGRLVADPVNRRVIALQPGDSSVSVVLVESNDTLRIPGGLMNVQLSLGSLARAAITPDGLLGVIPTSGFQPNGGVALMDLDRHGFATGPLVRGGRGVTHTLDIDASGRLVASLDTESSRLVVQGITREPPPRLARALLLENVATVDGLGQAGEQLLLTFERAIRPPAGFVDPDDLFVFNFQSQTPGSLGTGALVIPTGIESNRALIILGGLPDVVAAGRATAVDIGEFPASVRFESFLERVPARDLGDPGVDDTGVDIQITMAQDQADIVASAGGVVSLPADPDALFSAHRLEIDPGALSGDATFVIGPPPLPVLQGGFANAVQISADSAVQFDPPAKLTIQFDPAFFSPELGQLRSLVRVVQLIDTGTEIMVAPVPGSVEVDTAAGTVSARISSLDPTGAAAPFTRAPLTPGTVGTFATLPINPVEERSIFIGPSGSGGAVSITLEVPLGPSPVSLSGGEEGAYLNHVIEVPNYQEVAPDDPDRTELTIRTATLFDRVSTSGGRSFPTQSAAIFVAEAHSAAGSPISFDDPVNLTIEFIERDEDDETDTVDFDGGRDAASKMRAVWDAEDGSAVDFQILAGQVAGSTVEITGRTPLTGPSGATAYGAVIDPMAPPGVAVEDIVDHILGITVLGPSDPLFIEADHEPDGAIDAADLVDFINR
jgi:6-phosphogluconolactonase (cycloisomerase 2 family)